ncbi:MAG: alpha-amylase family glycosyl hydrolase, partial [Gammaproteobacteria bacterium]
MADTGWWRSAAIYQIYPRSFRDSNADGIGDLEGIRERLGYVAALGVDAVWICPFVRSPMRDFGYDVSDYLDVEPIFGTLTDFDALLSEAHALGLRVIIDQVWNHTSDQHRWFQESRQSRDNAKADWYVWADAAADGGPPNNWRATFGGSAWTWEPQRHQYYLHNFLSEQPDLNWYNPQVRAALLDVGRFWLDRGVDGFRLDVVNFYAHDRSLRDNPRRPPGVPRPAGAAPKDPYFDYINIGTVGRPEALELLAEVRALHDEYPGTFTLGEISSAEDALASAAEFVRGTRRLHTAYNASLISHEPFTQTDL